MFIGHLAVQLPGKQRASADVLVAQVNLDPSYPILEPRQGNSIRRVM